MIAGGVATYARVFSEGQARENTIASQLASLRERVAADGFLLEPDDCYVDEGCGGSVLVRPALQRLRDAAASGRIERLCVHASDRLARRYAHQAPLIDELRRAGVDIVFLNRPIGDTPEDDLLLQVQGAIAEYERAKILERGRRHAARSGSVSALTRAPFGYRYVSRGEGGGAARFEAVEEEARIIRFIFAGVGFDRLSLREVCRRLRQMDCRTRRGLVPWNASTIRGMCWTIRPMSGARHSGASAICRRGRSCGPCGARKALAPLTRPRALRRLDRYPCHADHRRDGVRGGSRPAR